jgi:adenine-specific DNA methylase
MTDKPRLIERAFPLKQASLTSVHEKNVRHGHISTLHIWPARRPLAACRAALLATLLPDPGTPEGRRKLCERIGGKVVEKIERKKMPNGSVVERVKEEVEGGILNWIGTEPKSGGRKKIEAHRSEVAYRESELNWFREEIKKAYGGRAPRVLDPFAGGGAIPLEAMRLGCEAKAVDINPVAWFILKCTLEYPQKLAGKTHPLPDFILEDEEFMESFYKAHPHLVGRTKKTKRQKENPQLDLLDRGDSGRVPKADLAWHVRAWGRWVLNEARKELAPFYPTYADFEPLDLKHPKSYEKQEMRLVPLKDDGTPDIDALNAEFSEKYLRDKKNPRWVAKPTVAYLWARTVKCKNCRAEVPLLKTRWLCKKDRKRILLTMEPMANGSGVEFGVQNNVPSQGGNAAQRREHDKRIGAGTMSRAGAQCPCCGTIMTMEDIRIEGKAGRLGAIATAVVTESQTSKQYRLPTPHELECAAKTEKELDRVFAEIPFGIPDEPTPAGGGRGAARAFSIQGYGLMRWRDLFSARQLLALGTLVRQLRRVATVNESSLPPEWREAVAGFLTILFDKTADYSSTVCTWHISGEKMRNTFARFAIPITWDVAEVAVTNEVGGSLVAQLEWITRYIDTALEAFKASPEATVTRRSATQPQDGRLDAVVTDPPYYDAIPYSDCMDFFYVWIKRIIHGTTLEKGGWLNAATSPKWNHDDNDGELIDDDSRHGGDSKVSKQTYEDGMARAFIACEKSLQDDGRLVIVFAHKHPNAWETLVSAIIRAGFIVDGSWPIQTEMGNRMRGMNSAALSSSVWLVCKKRPITARPGWDNKVLEEMRSNITERLHAYWDAGIRGPDFVWAATGPAMEAYSKHPIVKKANAPGEVLGVGEFLSLVRRMVVDFVVGQVLTGQSEGSDMAAADRMDATTAYYLLHRHDFGLDEAPAGACILYATACGLSDRDLESALDLVSHKGTRASTDNEDEEADPDVEAEPEENGDSGSKIKLKTWAQRNRRSMGFEAPSGRPIPLIDRIHRLMHLWRAGDVHKVDEYLDDNGLRRQELFKRLVQSLIELSTAGSEERSLLESLSNHVQAKGATVPDAQIKMTFGDDDIADSDKEQ